MADTTTGLQLRSIIKKSGELEISLVQVPIAEPGPEEVVVRVEASPLNPSDLGLLTGAAVMSTARSSGSPQYFSGNLPGAGVMASTVWAASTSLEIRLALF